MARTTEKAADQLDIDQASLEELQQISAATMGAALRGTITPTEVNAVMRRVDRRITEIEQVLRRA